MNKRILTLLLGLALAVSVLPHGAISARAASIQTSAAQVSGGMFTDNGALAEKLDAVFAGAASIYSDAGCSKSVNAALGTRAVAPGKTLYVGARGKWAVNSGESCWIYANGVYYALFGEALGNGTPGANSEKLSLSGTSGKLLTYSNLKTWGVRQGVGAQVRVGSHSILILAYDESGLTYLDGNGDGKGLIALRRESWSEVKSNSSIGGSKKVSYIIQPKQSYLDAAYPDAAATFLGKCTVYPAYCTLRLTAQAGILTLPAAQNGQTLTTLAKGTAVTALELYQNPAGEYWYQVRTAEGRTGYLAAEKAEMTALLSDVCLSGVSAPGKLVRGSSFSLRGTIATEYTALIQVGAYVEQDGKLLTGTRALELSAHSYTLKGSQLNQQIKFGTLPVGGYTYYVRAVCQSYYVKDGTQLVANTREQILYSEEFTVYEKKVCSHSYQMEAAPSAGYVCYTCTACGHSYQVQTSQLLDPERVQAVLHTDIGSLLWQQLYGTPEPWSMAQGIVNVARQLIALPQEAIF